jgi:pyrroline-5-carboxylate reductase
MAAISPGAHCDEAHLEQVETMLRSVGRVVRIPEKHQDAVTAISGSGPAYLFYGVEAMIEAGVLLGLPRGAATELTVQTLVGAGKMLRETGEHPTVLRENVSSPAGTTVAALSSTATRCTRPSSRPWKLPGTARGPSPAAASNAQRGMMPSYE